MTSPTAATVLIVDDEMQNRDLLEELLRQEGYLTVSAANGEDALVSVARSAPDLILLDFMGPGMDGYQLASTLKANKVTSGIPVIMVTAQIDRGARRVALDAGVDELLAKPVDRSELQPMVRNLSRLKAFGVENVSALPKQQTQALRASELSYRRLFEAAQDGILILDADTGRINDVNPFLVNLLGFSASEMIGQTVGELSPFKDIESNQIMLERLQKAGYVRYENLPLETRGGRRVAVEFVSNVYQAGDKKVIQCNIRDISERKAAADRIAHLNRVYAVLSGINSLIVRVRDRDVLFREACRVAVEQGGFRMAMIGIMDRDANTIVPVASAGKDEALLAAIKGILASSEDAPNSMVAWAIREKKGVVSNNSKSDPRVLLGSKYAEFGVRSMAVLPLLVADKAVGLLTLHSNEIDYFQEEEMKLLTELAGDIAFAIDHIERGEKLSYLAYYDALTGIANEHFFRDCLEKFVGAARQVMGKVCVVVVDLKDFTRINNSFGRNVGDKLLREVGEHVQACLVEPYVLGRIGADTFAAASPRDGGLIATQLRDAMLNAIEQTFNVDGHRIRLSAQAGIAFFPTDGADSDSVFRNAAVALQLAKSSGERYVYYSSEMQAQIAQRLAIEEQLRVAISLQQFVVHYQPRVNMMSGEIVGAEALIRLQHPERGLITPKEFIALAEETGLIVPIGAWVIQHVCAQQAAWIAAGIATVPIAVNVSSIQFEKGDLVQTVREALDAHGLSAKYLELELTESAVMDDPLAATGILQTLHKLGVGLTLDDFGTGFSSLAHLRRFPFDAVKIDQSFVTDITHNAEDAAIATAIIAMAHRLSLKVVAEGVEAQGQFDFLRGHACDEMQGFYFSAAVVSEEFESQLRTSKRIALPTPAPADQRTLLVVDDESGIRSALMRTLRRDGYHILSAVNGPEALDMLAVNPVQVIISDQRMPEMSGTEFLNIVKQLYPDTMRIILSGYTDLKVVADSVNRGAVFKFLTKPWDDDLLREQVRDAFRHYRRESPGI